jgi:hypothetical protein
MPLSLLLILLGSLSNCGSAAGPKVTGCAVDSPNESYQCVQYPDFRFTLSFAESEGYGLKCVSPYDLDAGLKACKKGQPIPVYTLCELDFVRHKFFCQRTDMPFGYFVDIKKVDNFFCMNDYDRKRIIERCNFSTKLWNF